MMNATHPVFVFGWLLAACGSVPAAEKPAAMLTGTVTYKGKPLAEGTIALHPKIGKPIVATIKDGKFAFKTIPVGTMRVSVTSTVVPKKYGSPATSGLTFSVAAGDNALTLDLK